MYSEYQNQSKIIFINGSVHVEIYVTIAVACKLCPTSTRRSYFLLHVGFIKSGRRRKKNSPFNFILDIMKKK